MKSYLSLAFFSSSLVQSLSSTATAFSSTRDGCSALAMHARGKLCARDDRKAGGSWLQEYICIPRATYQSFSTCRGGSSYFDCTIGQKKRSSSKMGVVELFVDFAYHLGPGRSINRENLSFTFTAYLPLIQASVCRHLFC
jgi:hypothetical protein